MHSLSLAVMALVILVGDARADEAATVNRIESLGGKVTRDKNQSGNPVIGVSFKTPRFSPTELNEADLKEFRHLKRLKTLDLEFTTITDAGVKALDLKRFKQLTTLNLSTTEVTEECLKELKDLKQLTWLALYSIKVTDAGLKDLKTLNGLETLWLPSGLTDAAVNDLQKALPKCKLMGYKKAPTH
jgi:hypothetical protein